MAAWGGVYAKEKRKSTADVGLCRVTFAPARGLNFSRPMITRAWTWPLERDYKVAVTNPTDGDLRAATDIESASDALLRGERAATVRAAIARLPKKQRATLILRVYHDLSHQEIAGILGSSVGAVKANFFHALGNLKKLLS